MEFKDYLKALYADKSTRMLAGSFLKHFTENLETGVGKISCL